MHCIHFENTREKFPDVFSVRYCVFGLLKKLLSQSKLTKIDGFWKIVEEEKKSIPRKISGKALLS